MMKILKTLTPRNLSFGGFSVKRFLPSRGLYGIGPWVFFDHLGPHRFSEGKGIDVIPHPHINLGTVTYLFEGEIVHRDTLGSVQTITPGAVNLMVAGKGIAHSERTGKDLRANGHTLHGLQLWHALPDNLEEQDPSFNHYSAEEIPEVNDGAVSVRVIAGSFMDMISPVKTFSPALFARIQMNKGSEIVLRNLPAEAALYVLSGEVNAENKNLVTGTFVLQEGTEAKLRAAEETRLIVLGGEPLGKRYMWWNFVSSRIERIEQAKAEWNGMKYGLVAEEGKEHASLPEADNYGILK